MTLDRIVTLAPLAWSVITAIANVLLRTATPEEWVERCERSPRFAAVTRFLRAWGTDPVKGVRALQEFLAANGAK
jgi:hypothetical protein